MGKKGKSTPAATPTPQVETPDVDVAQLAAKKALDAREGATTAVKAEEEENKQPKVTLASAQAAPAQQPQRKQPRRSMDPASMMAGAGMSRSAVLTG